MSDPGKEQTAKNQPALSGGPPRPSKVSAPEVEGPPNPSGKTVYLLDPMAVRDLASVLRLKPFRIVADLMELKLFKSTEDSVDFETASRIARKHGYRAERPPPGFLVL